MHVWGPRAVSQLQLEGVLAAAAKCDVSKKHEVDQLVAWTVQTYGSLDILVANAGIVKVQSFLLLRCRIDVDKLVEKVLVQERTRSPPGPSKNACGGWSITRRLCDTWARMWQPFQRCDAFIVCCFTTERGPG